MISSTTRHWHSVYQALPRPYQSAIDIAFRSMADSLMAETTGLGPQGEPITIAGDDRAEELVAAMARFVVMSNPDNAAIQQAALSVQP